MSEGQSKLGRSEASSPSSSRVQRRFSAVYAAQECSCPRPSCRGFHMASGSWLWSAQAQLVGVVGGFGGPGIGCNT
ncbi:hypothetical protein E2C01_083547 [Portunus trituberculatus]|uniref:Uncharacterized protein n=1 Tax=Portunus trituberculatus TaxID=210409 RepID=A0A5B7ISR9_PORTR|nr:hypothetical protein [Portunus trituberculatus]